MNENLITVVLLAYNRPWHTEQVLRALKNNILAEKSHLIIFIDGLKNSHNEQHIKNHNRVIEVVQMDQWCKTVDIRISDINRGCRYGPIYGITQALEEFEEIIVLEDDIVTSPFFLLYMNKALSFYKGYKSVFSVSAYNFPPIIMPIPSDYSYDVFISPRQKNWGWGTWRDRWNLIDWNKEFIPEFLNKKYEVMAFNRGGEDLSKMLNEEYLGLSDAWDIQFTFAHFKFHAVSIIPCHSYTNNIGLDDSGTHTINQQSDFFNNDLCQSVEDPLFLDVLYEDVRLMNYSYSIYYPKKRPLWKKVINRISRTLGGKNIFIIKKKIYS